LSKVAVPVREGTLRVQATDSRSEFEVTTDGVGVVGHAGAALLGVARCLLVGGASAVQDTDAAAFLAVAGPC
jgi:ribosomal protein S9